MTVCSLAHFFTKPPDSTLVAWEGNTQHTCADFLHAIATQRQHLLARPEQRWLLAHDNSYHFAIGFFALLATGKHIVLPPNTQTGTLAALADFFDASFSAASSQQTSNTNSKNLNEITLNLDTLTVTLLTSGSTGEAKAIRKTLRCLDNEIHALESLWGNTLGDAAVFATVSHQHIYGLLFRLLWPLCAGRAFAATTHSYPEPLIAELQQHSRTVLISSPSQLKRFPPTIDLSAVRTSLRAVFSSGGLLPLEAAQDWQQRWRQAPIEVLGSTETGGVAWRQQTTHDAPWQTLPTVCVSVDAEQQLFVQSSFTGTDKIIAMGDSATLLDEQHFQLHGRIDRIVKVEEKRLSLTAMEHRLHASPFIEEARVLALPQTSGRLGVVASLRAAGQQLLATQGKPALMQQLREHLSQHFERVLLPRKWRFVATLPVDRQGKTSHAVLTELFSDQRILHFHFSQHSADFDGHFPNLPILPGVKQFDLAVRHCSHWYALTQFRGIEKLKFSEPIVPDDTVTLTLQHLRAGQVQFAYTIGEQSLSSGLIIFEQPVRSTP